MEQPCYKCGQQVDDGRPFCPHCAAPQIRVIVAEPAVAAMPALASRDANSLSSSETVPVLALPWRWSEAMKPCILAAMVATLLMALGLNPFVGMFSVGFLAVVFYRQGRPVAIKPGTGIRLGAFGGLICFGFTVLLAALASMVPDFRARLRDQILENSQKWAVAHPGDPQMQAALDQLKTPEGLAMMMIIGGVLLLVIAIVLGGLGGALGGAIFGRRGRS